MNMSQLKKGVVEGVAWHCHPQRLNAIEEGVLVKLGARSAPNFTQLPTALPTHDVVHAIHCVGMRCIRIDRITQGPDHACTTRSGVGLN
jgi:hypothetical protein